MNSQQLAQLALSALEDLKGHEIVELDIRAKSSMADCMIVATGTSQRHVKSLAENVRQVAKESGNAPLGIEGEEGGEWVLVDLADVIVHVMTAETREFYSLEKLWSVGTEASEAASDETKSDAASSV